MIVINNPNNPTGKRVPGSTLASIIDIAQARDIILFSDEVYRPLFHDLFEEGSEIPPPVTSYGYKKTVFTGSMSKSYALAGIRVGWVASPDKDILLALAVARDHTTISVSQLDDQVAAYAMSNAIRPGLLKRNVELARTNLSLLAEFVERYPSVCSWIKPDAGTVAFVKFMKDGRPVDDESFCIEVLQKTKAFFVPGSRCFGRGEDFRGYVRIGYVGETAVLAEALKRLGEHVEAVLL